MIKEAPGQTFVAAGQDTGEILGTGGSSTPTKPAAAAMLPTQGTWWGANNSGQGIARALCAYSLTEAKAAGFLSMQYNAVVESNVRAVWLWQSMGGFKILATVPEASTTRRSATWASTSCTESSRPTTGLAREKLPRTLPAAAGPGGAEPTNG